MENLSSSYVSDELIHFLGRSRGSDDERYDLLREILRGGHLAPNGKKGDYLNVRFDSSMPLHTQQIDADCLCFCDIPLNALKIHTAKYGKFGIGFKKPFLMRLGVNPVFYYQTDQPEQGDGLRLPKGERLRLIVAGAQKIYHRYRDDGTVHSVEILNSAGQPVGEQRFTFKKWYEALVFEILGYMKPFTLANEPNHPENYYMEREWRSLTYIEFTPADISTIILPSAFSAKFYADMPPGFHGEIVLI